MMRGRLRLGDIGAYVRLARLCGRDGSRVWYMLARRAIGVGAFGCVPIDGLVSGGMCLMYRSADKDRRFLICRVLN